VDRARLVATRIDRFDVDSEGARLAGVIHLPGAGRWPCVLASHGMLSTKDSEKYTALADRLTLEGIGLIRFDFRGCGESEGKLHDSTAGARITDLRAVLEAAVLHGGCDGRIGLFGSSMGGYIALHVSKEDPRVRAIVTWASPAHLRDLLARRDATGFSEMPDPFYEELSKGQFIEAPAGVARCLFVHGGHDELVPAEHARSLFERSRHPKELQILDKADHRFTDPGDRDRAMAFTIHWFRTYLLSAGSD